MSTEPVLTKSTDRNRPRLFRILNLTMLISMLSVNLASAQGNDVKSSGVTAEEFQRLYDCSSYYYLINQCYSSVKSEESHRLSVIAFDNRDKIIHLIFINGKQSEVLSETTLSGMKSSIENMIKSTAGQCQNVLKLSSSLGLSCDKIIENVPKQSYDKGKKSGSLNVQPVA